MQLKYRGIAYNPADCDLAPVTGERTGMYRGVAFRSQISHSIPQKLGVRMTYRGQHYLG